MIFKLKEDSGIVKNVLFKTKECAEEFVKGFPTNSREELQLND